MGKILIAVPHGGAMEIETFTSIYNMQRPEGHEVEFKAFYGYNIDHIRNAISDHAIKGGYDSVLFIDSDMSIPRDSLVRMLSANVDIVSGVYVKKNDDKKIPVAMIKELGREPRYLTPDEISGKGMMEVDAVGFGCVLVKTEVLSRIGYPQFQYRQALEVKNTTGEDIDFCLKAKYRNFRVYLMTDLILGHIGRKKYTI
jgi:GT2 family glycosyltransferase